MAIEEMKLTEAIEESNPVKVSLSILGVILAGIVINWMLTPFPGARWITPLITVLCYLGSIAVNFMKAEAEEKGYKVEEAKTRANDAISYAKQYKHQLGEANKLIAELKAKAVDIERLSTAQRDLATAQRDLATAKQELSTARTELATAQDKISTQLALLSTAKQELSTATDAINKQRQLIKKLTPIQVAWEDFKAYKRYESAVKQPSLSADEREGARVKRDDYKDAWKKAIDEGV